MIVVTDPRVDACDAGERTTKAQEAKRQFM